MSRILTSTLSRRFRMTVSCCLAVLILEATGTQAQPESWTPPRTPEGRPDLQGIWTNATQTPLVRPAEFGERRALNETEAQEREQRALVSEQRGDAPVDPDRPPPSDGNTAAAYNTFWLERGTGIAYINGEYRTSLIIDPPNGRIPLRGDAPLPLRDQWLARAGVGEFDGPELMSPGDRCLIFWDFRTSSSSSGPPMLPLMYNNNYQIVQTRDYVMILTEMMSDARIIRLDAEPLPEGMYRWMGDSVGYWDGDTLVVHTEKLHPQQSHFGSSSEVRITEHFTRESEDQIVYRVTVEDPAVYTAPWTAEIPMRARPHGERIYEYACHEGNYALPGILAGARRIEGP
jgi:hypothetical protein